MSDEMVNGLTLAAICFILYSLVHWIYGLFREQNKRVDDFLQAEEIAYRWEKESKKEINKILHEIERIYR